MTLIGKRTVQIKEFVNGKFRRGHIKLLNVYYDQGQYLVEFNGRHPATPINGGQYAAHINIKKVV